ncbi:MAG TPA: TonB-dependent receptor [Gemmatimonadaceae bacterium]
MRSPSLRSLITVLSMTLFASTALAQTGMITGRVTEAGSGRGVTGARVQAVTTLRSAGSVVTDENGNYRIGALPAGTYDVVVTRIGYRMARNPSVSVGSGATAEVNIAVNVIPSQLEMVITTAARAPQKVVDAPASVSVVNEVEINERPSINVTDHVAALPGIDVARGGLMQANVVARGFNNIFSGAMMTLTDNRFAFVPSLRVNIPYLQSQTNEDIERIEVVLGPGAALYGPNTPSGVMHVITKSPFSSQGTTLTVDGGNRSVLRGAFRGAYAPSQKFAAKISADVFRGKEWPEFQHDTLERVARDTDLRRWGGEARVDFRPTAASEIIGTYGRAEAGSAVEPTGLGPAQVKDWVSQNFQLRGRINRLFGQVFLNTSDAGGTFLLRTVRPTTKCPDVADPACIIDKSRQLAAQVQHGWDFGLRQRFLYGFDYIHTMPKTEGTINGRNEDDDDITEVGGYVHSVTQLTRMFELTAAARVDKHSRLEDPVFSPRLALVFKPQENQSLRVTYNRAFSTPSTNNLFLDLLAGRIPSSGTQLYGVRALGVPESGLTFARSCATGVGSLCMRVPVAFGGNPATLVPADASLMYPAAFAVARAGVVASLTASFTAAMVPNAAAVATAVANFLGSLRPSAAQAGTVLRVLQPENGTFRDVAATDLRDVARLKPTIHNTIEAGYKGILGDILQLSVDVWHEHRKNFVGPLIIETPNVFLDRTTLSPYLQAQLTGFLQLAGFPAAVAAATAGQIAPSVAAGLGGITTNGVTTATTNGIPLGVVNFSEALSAQSDVIVTYRNFGDLNVWGSDVGAEVLLPRGFSVYGTYSYVNKDFFPRSEVGGVQDISLNAPANKGSVSLRYRDEAKGVSGELRGRHVASFPVYSFINGTIATYNLVDAQVSVRPTFLNGVLWSLNATNLLDKKHREFVGGGAIGRLIMTRLQVTF